MDPAAYLGFIRDDGEALAEAAAGAPGADVSSCPGWDMTDLVAHVGRVHQWVDQILETKAQEYLKRSTVPLEGVAETMAWYRDGLHRLLTTLSATDPDQAVWNWRDGAPAPARFWFRRMAQETAVHRWDGENAASPGRAHPIDSDLAVDGIDEYLSFVARWLAGTPVAGLAGSLHLHATDCEGEWSMQIGPDSLELSREHRTSDAAIRGPVSDLYLWMLNRIPRHSATLTRFGNDELMAAWAELKF